MKPAILAFLFAVMAPAALYASPPGMQEGPPGCEWLGIIGPADRTTGNTPVLLDKLIGTCIQAHGVCGKSGDIVVIPPAPDARKLYSPGQSAEVWVVGINGSFTIPACWPARAQ